jgi:hypothetical protein
LFHQLTNPAVKKIITYMLEDLYSLTFGGDFGLYYSAAYALSIFKGEEERRKSSDYVPLDIKLSSKQLNFIDIPINTVALDMIVDNKQESIFKYDDSEDSDYNNDDDDDVDYVFDERDSQYSDFEREVRISRKEKETLSENDEKDCLLTLCEKINKINIRLATISILNHLWKKLYPTVSLTTLSEVSTIFLDYWTRQSSELPLGSTLLGAESNYEYWNNVKNIMNNPESIAADFAIRMTCAGVTECGVEREFSYIRWILGYKRLQLSDEKVRDLLILKNSNI